MDNQDVSLFSLSREGQLGDILSPFEYVLSVTARGSTLFALTSNGRIITLNEEFKVTGEAKLPPQKKNVSDHARIEYVDISCVLIVLFNNTLYFFRIEEKTAELLYSKTDVHRFDLSSAGTQKYFPEHDLVFVNTRNQVFRVLLSIEEQKERVVWRWKADSQVSAISFDGSAVCLTTQTACYVHSFDTAEVEPIEAFKYDKAVLPLNAPPPSICHVDEGEFVVAGCLPNIAIFVDVSGAAARVPLAWNNEHPRSVVRTESNLVVIGEAKLIVFDNSSGRMRQELVLPAHPCACGLIADDVVIFTRATDADVFCVRQLSWAQKANDLLEKGELESALYVVSNNVVKSDEDLITYRQVHVRLGFEKISTKDHEEAIGLLLEGQVTPFDVSTHFAAVFDKVDSPADKIGDVILVERLVSRVLEQEWSMDLAKDWATLLTIARVRLSESPIDLVDVLETSEDYDRQAVDDYVEGRKLVNAQLVLRVIAGPISEALSMEWLDSSLLPLVDRQLLVALLQRLDSADIEIVQKWKDFLMEDSESEQQLLDLVRSKATSFDEQFILDLFNGRENELEVVLCLYRDSEFAHSSQLKKRMAQLATVRLSPTQEEISAEESARLRKMLIEIILTDKDVDLEPLLIGDYLTVERVVAANRTNPEKAIQGVIESVEFPGALQAIQQIIQHFSSSHSTLSTHFLQQLKRKCESDPSAAASLRLPEVMRTVIEASPAIISSGAIKFIPDNSSLETFAPLIFRELQAVSNGSVSCRLKKALGEHVTGGIEDPMHKCSFTVSETTRCGVCNRKFDPQAALHFLPSGKIIHSGCHPHINVCPVTNQVFRG